MSPRQEADDEKKVHKMFASSITPQIIYLWLQGLFLFSLVWSIGANLNVDGRDRFNIFFRDVIAGINPQYQKPKTVKLTKSNIFPERGTIYDYYFEKSGAGKWVDWISILSRSELDIPDNAKVNDVIVQTSQTALKSFFFQLYVTHKVFVILLA